MTLEVVEVEVTEVDNGHAQGGRQPREVRQTDIDKEFVKESLHKGRHLQYEEQTREVLQGTEPC